MSRNIQSLYQDIKKKLQDVCVATPELDAKLLIMAATGLDHADFITGKERELSDKTVAVVEADIVRRIAGEPVSRILGMREFWGLEFEVTSDTLDPRPDTETLVEASLRWALKEAPCPQAGGRDAYSKNKPFRILDLGTGTGCILIALLSELPDATGVAVDFSHKAASVARCNAEKHGLEDRFSVIQGDWMSALKPESFDLFVSR